LPLPSGFLSHDKRRRNSNNNHANPKGQIQPDLPPPLSIYNLFPFSKLFDAFAFEPFFAPPLRPPNTNRSSSFVAEQQEEKRRFGAIFVLFLSGLLSSCNSRSFSNEQNLGQKTIPKRVPNNKEQKSSSREAFTWQRLWIWREAEEEKRLIKLAS